MRKIVFKITDTDLIYIVKESSSYVELTEKLNNKLNINVSNKTVRQLVKNKNILTNHFKKIIVEDRWSKNNLLECIEESNNYKDIIVKLGLSVSTSTYYRLHKYLNKYSIDFKNKNKYYKNKNNIRWSKENLSHIIKSSNSNSDVLYNLGLNAIGDNIKTLKKYINEYGINIDHFNYDRKGNNRSYKLSDILIQNSSYNRGRLKDRLYKEGLKKRICELCGQDEMWKGKKISLILDHKNGINNDNRLENLRIVCPNCNAGLDTHCGKNIKTPNKDKKIKKCNCGEVISKRSSQCPECYNLSRRKVERPTKEELLKMIKDTSYVKVGKKYGVSDNTIRKWLK